MLQRYCTSHPYLRQIDYEKFEGLFLIDEEDDIVDRFLKRLADFQSVTRDLQSGAALLWDSRALFDSVVNKILLLNDRFNDRAIIVEKCQLWASNSRSAP